MNSYAILNELYPRVEKALLQNDRKFLSVIADFINQRHEELHAVAPYTRILFGQREIDKIFNSIGMQESEALDALKKMFFWGLDYRPLCAKEPYVQVLMCAIRYYVKKNNMKMAKLVTVYLCFSGKLYASLHSLYWKYPPKEQIMDYVVNNMLSDKFDLKKEGTLFKSFEKMSDTWLTTYNAKISDPNISDDVLRLLLQQLRDRENNFLKNIATLYYEAADNKLYLNYETDSLSAEDFRITTNDATNAARLTQAAVGIITSRKVSIDRCNKCANESVRPLDLKDIMESIFTEPENIPQLKRVINIIICDFMANNRGKRVGSLDFIEYTTKAKPNTKNPLIIEMKTTITGWLSEYSIAYKRTKRPGTLNNYFRAVITYLAFTISEVSLS